MKSIIHVDGGANAHILRDRKHFWKYVPYEGDISQVAGTPAPFIGMGIAPATFPGSDYLYLLYPCYYMTNNPQDTLSAPALKYYNQARSTRVEALAWFRVI